MKDFAAAQWQRARRALESARILVEEDQDGAASRAYYAAFYAVTALLAMEGRAFKKHTGVRAALHKDLVRAQRLSVEVGEGYDFLMDLRDEADYGGISSVSRDNALLAVSKAQAIMEAVAKACPELGQPL